MLRQFPIQTPEHLYRETWYFIYEARHFNEANDTLASLQFASKNLGITVEDPVWVEIQRPNADEMEKAMNNATRGFKKEQLPTMAMILLNRENDYKDLKNKCLQMGILS